MRLNAAATGMSVRNVGACISTLGTSLDAFRIGTAAQGAENYNTDTVETSGILAPAVVT